MLIRISDDLHIEHWGDYHSNPMNNGRDWNSYTFLKKMDNEKEQTLFLAGDIVMIKYLPRYEPFFDEVSERFKEVIVVPGNHEFYRNNFLTATQEYRNFLSQYKNITLLENESIIRDDIAIFGGILWTDFNNRDPFAIGYASNAMSDYMVIEYSPQDNSAHMKFTPELSVLEHEKTIEEMKKFFKNSKDMKQVIITHHAPSKQSTSMKYWNSPLNPAFSSNLDKFIKKYKPVLWHHGHHHSNSDYIIENTRIVCNPYGYGHGTENPEYNPELVIEI